MEYLKEDRMLKYEPDTLNAVRKEYELHKPGAVAGAVDILEEWIQTQPHFTKKKFSREYLERIIISTKGSVERAKARLDKLFTLRTILPSFFKMYNPRTEFVNMQDIVSYAVLPKMTKDHERVYVNRIQGNNLSSKFFAEGYRFCIMLTEYVAAHDYAKAYHIVIDYRNVAISEMMAHVNIQELREAVLIFMEGYGVRMKGIHILIDSVLVDAVIKIAKQVLSEKVGKRIHTHKNLDTLHEHIQMDVLPKDYGGDDKLLQELHDDWKDTVSTKEFQNYWKEMLTARTDEALRPKDKFNEQYVGMPGTFRTLSVD